VNICNDLLTYCLHLELLTMARINSSDDDCDVIKKTVEGVER